MGALTYGGAILLAPIALAPGGPDDAGGLTGLVGSFVAVPFLWMFGGAALAPLLAVCLTAGPLWATCLRLTTSGPGRGGRPSAASLPLWPIVALGAALLALELLREERAASLKAQEPATEESGIGSD